MQRDAIEEASYLMNLAIKELADTKFEVLSSCCLSILKLFLLTLLIKKAALYNFLPKKQRIYDCFYEFASEALHIDIFENFVESMTPCLSKLKVTPSFCFTFKIPDNPTATDK